MVYHFALDSDEWRLRSFENYRHFNLIQADIRDQLQALSSLLLKNLILYHLEFLDLVLIFGLVARALKLILGQ